MNRSLKDWLKDYRIKVDSVWDKLDHTKIEILALNLFEVWKNEATVFICGNGGSATNANHLANDLLFGINPVGKGIKVHSLCANSSINTCLANDTGYENVFCKQLNTLGTSKDILIALSGSGNSENIINVIKEANKIGMQTHGFFGFDGGIGKALVDNCIHFEVNDMQISEDFQMIIGHIIMKNLRDRK